MVINTGLGKVIVEKTGVSTAGKSVYSAVSIPYARANRFEKPILIDNYPKGKPINSDKTICFPQHGYPMWMNIFLKNHMMRPEFLPMKDVQSEEAFVVNIWTDDFDGNKPVLVFIHGGGEGSGTVPIYTGSNIAKKGIVAVTITYRIGYFGYLPYFENGNMTANLAYFDQQAALLWVRKNIQHFGGNPNNITLMGHCGGGLSCLYQFLNPISNKQFDKLILCAGNLPSVTSRENAEIFFNSFLKRKGISNPESLKKVPFNKIIDRKNPIAKGDVVDGDFFVDDPDILLSQGKFPSIPVLLGTNADEFSMVENKLYYKALGITTDYKKLDKVLSQKYGSYGKMLKEAVKSEAGNAAKIQIKIMELMVFHNSTYQMMKKFSEKCPVYGYRLNYVPDLYHGLRGAYHGAELALFFDNMDKMNINISNKNRKQTKLLQHDWLQFIKTGSIPERERYDQARRITNYGSKISSIEYPLSSLLDKINDAGLCNQERKRYQSTM